ncbi:MAG: efflux RND transporter periplasmic adaptor subunit [Pseudomonadota bacterium]
MRAHAADNKRDRKERPFLRWLARTVVSLGLLGGIGVASAAAIGAIQRDAGQAQAQILVDDRATPVVTTVAVSERGYEVPRQYTGRTVIAQETDLAFEVGGRVTLANVDLGDRVVAGTILGRVDSARLRSNEQELRALLLRAHATRDQARDDLNRSAALLASGAVTQTRVEQDQTAFEQAEQDIDALIAQIERLEFDLRDTELRAPFDGIVTSVSFERGDIASPGAPVLRLVNPESVEAHIGVPITAAMHISQDQVLPLDWRGATFNATVSSLVPVVNADSQTMLLVLEWEAQTHALEGEALTVTLSQEIAQPGFWVPLDALVSDLRGLFAVQTVIAGDTGKLEVNRAPVQVHYSDGSRAYVSGALQDGDRIVTRGTNRVAPGQTVVLAAVDGAQ